MEATAAAPSRARVLQAFRSRNFRLLWTGQAISLLGDAAFVVALGWRTFTLTGSARSLGLVLTFQGVGVLTTVLVGGALADRYNRRALMLVSDAARFGVIGALALVDASGPLGRAREAVQERGHRRPDQEAALAGDPDQCIRRAEPGVFDHERDQAAERGREEAGRQALARC
ncbi:MAG TPA: MFS transporter [Gaiellaceae bacterium]|nr:MFS transporter [Gaiellaceae bacterium]